MRIVFAGTPDFAAIALARLLCAGVDVALVLTQPDRPAGRGMRMHESAVRQTARAAGIEVAQPASLKRDPEMIAKLHATPHDLMVVAAYGLILPPWVLDLPRLGCLNIHGSLLPRWRGAAPIQRAIEAGDKQTGITIMQMDAGLDTGDRLLAEAVAIATDDTTGSLQDRLAALGGKLIVEALELAARGRLVRAAQPAEGVSYAHKIDKAEAAIDWRQSAVVIERRIRAFDPFPGASALLGGELIKCWRGRIGTARGTPGVVLCVAGDAVTVACGEASLSLTELQRAGGKRLAARDFLQSVPLKPGMRFQPRPD